MVPTAAPPGSDTPASGPTAIDSTPREAVLLGGRVRLAEKDWPLLGNAQAERMIALLFDVTCVDCRALYQLLSRGVVSAPERLAVLLIPVPLDRSCNAGVPADTPLSTEACNYMRLFWAAWQFDGQVHLDFRRWLLNESAPPPYAQARQWLTQRLGSRLTLAILDNSIEMRIGQAVGLYRRMPNDKLPQLLFEDRLIVGRVADLDELWAALKAASVPVEVKAANLAPRGPSGNRSAGTNLRD